MAKGSSEYTLVSARYASALLDMAAENKLIEKIEKDLDDLAAMIEASEDLQRLIDNPLYDRDQQTKAILALAEKAKFQKLTAHFLGVLSENRRLNILRGVIKAYKNEVRQRRGEVEAHVESAYALSPAQTNALQEELSKVTGANVTLDVAVNKELLGGLIVTVGSQMFDNSVRRKLERLQRRMSSGSNENEANLKEVG